MQDVIRALYMAQLWTIIMKSSQTWPLDVNLITTGTELYGYNWKRDEAPRLP